MSSIRIEKLTPQQEERLAEFRDKWIRIGLSTEPANRPEAEEGVRQAYAAAGLPAPRIVWTSSPLAQGLTRAVIQQMCDGRTKLGKCVRDSVGDSVWASAPDSVWASVRDSVRASVWDSVWASAPDSVWASVRDSVRASAPDSVWASVRDSVRASLGDSVGASVWDSVWDSVGASVWASVWDSVWATVRESVWASVGARVWASVWASVWDSVRASVRDSVWDSVGDSVVVSGYGQYDASWLAFYEYFREVCGLHEQTEELQGLFLIAQNAGWFLPHQSLCWIAERPSVCRQDERFRLHCADGPAVLYPDGCGIWSWHGVRVPQHVIEKPESITVAEIQREENAEVRRVMVERYGQARFLQDAGAKLLHTDEIGELYRIELKDDEPLVMVKVLNSTPEPDGSRKPYFLRVNPELRPLLKDGQMGEPQPMTARAAVASTFGMTADEYAKHLAAES